MQETSRDTAIELLSEILEHRDRLQQTDTLRNVPINALFDSELEARFIEALRRIRADDQLVSLSKDLVNGKPGYFFRIGERAYYIEPQVALGPEDGVRVPTRADFMFYPARTQEGGKPVAVFTDGYLYHRNRIGQDLAQRMAIVQSGRFHVWSLTWKDVENRYRTQENFFRNYLDPSRAVNGNNLGALLEGYSLGQFRDAHRGDSFDWLMRFLRAPDEQQWQQYAFVQGLIQLNPPRFATTQAGLDDQKGYKSLLHGVVPTVRHFSSFREEVDGIAQYLRQVENEGESLSEVCLVARTNELLKQYESALSAKSCQTYLVRRSEAEDRSVPGLRLATMHRVKGLEFNRVIIAGANEGVMPYEGAGSESADPAVQRESEIRERALLYVSATRAKQEVLVSSFGKASRFLANL